MSVDMNALKKLRATTHAPLSDCKSALEHSWNDMSAAQERLKERWAIKAAKNSSRETNEWIVLVTNRDELVVWLKLACETDFVAKNDLFISLGEQINEKIRGFSREISSIKDLSVVELADLNKVLQDNFVTVWENMKIVDAFSVKKNAYIYMHWWNKLAAIVFYSWEESIAKNVALQVAAMNPMYYSMWDVPQEDVSSVKNEINDALSDSKKPDNILEKIVSWRLDKHFSELVLLEQTSIFDDAKKVKDTLWDTQINWFIRYSI